MFVVYMYYNKVFIQLEIKFVVYYNKALTDWLQCFFFQNIFLKYQ